VNAKFYNNAPNGYIQVVQVMQNFQNFAQLEQNWGKNLLKKDMIIQNEEVCTSVLLEKSISVMFWEILKIDVLNETELDTTLRHFWIESIL
jgi:hypothetical protein